MCRTKAFFAGRQREFYRCDGCARATRRRDGGAGNRDWHGAPGRLNVLVNTLGKMPADLFAEFKGKPGGDLPSGDVKYHKGFSSDVSIEGGPVHLSLTFNPSHLEI